MSQTHIQDCISVHPTALIFISRGNGGFYIVCWILPKHSTVKLLQCYTKECLGSPTYGCRILTRLIPEHSMGRGSISESDGRVRKSRYRTYTPWDLD